MNKNELRFLLREKYFIKESVISDFLNGDISFDISSAGFINNHKLPVDLKSLQSDIDALYKGYPLAYLIGYVEFMENKIDLRYKTLIPRPETEFWTNEACKIINEKYQNRATLNILDLFCGSGCIGISVLKSLKNSHLTFADISEDAVKQTTFNLKLNKIEKGRYRIIKSDIFSEVKGSFDIIFANPPYVGIHDEVGPEIFNEPTIAIYGGESGLDIIKEFLIELKSHISESSILFMEIGETQKKDIELLAKDKGYKTKFNKDQFNKWRWVEMTYA